MHDLITFRLTVEYDGTEFMGWQRQPGRRTVQGTLEEAVARLAGRHVTVSGAGRTDAGTHAAGQVAVASLSWMRGAAALLKAMNGLLPADVAIRAVAAVPPSFDPRRDAIARWYRYTWLVRPARSPLYRRGVHWIDHPLSVPLIRAAAKVFSGRHDFTAFTTKAAAKFGATRRIIRIGLAARGDLLLLDVEGDGFLQHMVRMMAGALQKVGEGGLTSAAIRHALTSRKGPVAPPVPARGLTLIWVGYAGERRPPAAWPPILAR